MRNILSRILSGELMRALDGKRRCLAVGLAIAVVAAGFFLWVRLQASTALARLNQPLPPLVVEASGEAVDLRTVAAGTRRVIVFYSPSCRTCREVLPTLQPFPQDLRLLMVNEIPDSKIPDPEELPAAARFRDRWHALSHAFTVAALPTILFVDGGGILRHGLIGRHERSIVQDRLREFATQPGGDAPQKP